MKQNRTVSICTVAIASLLLVASHASAVLTNVNFNGFTGGNLQSEVEATLSGPAGGLNTRWNQYADEDSTGVMVDSTGAPTTITFTTNFTEGRTGNVNNLPIYRSTLTDFGRSPVTRNLTISGLVDGSLYDVWIVAYRDQGTPTERLSGTWSTTNATTSPSAQLLDSTTTQSDLAFTEGVTFLKFANVEANALGQIVFNAQSSLNPFASAADITNGNTHHRLGLSGFQIQAVAAPPIPEPATASLGLLTLGALMLRRRRMA